VLGQQLGQRGIQRGAIFQSMGIACEAGIIAQFRTSQRSRQLGELPIVTRSREKSVRCGSGSVS
jgi:hypothetical protein